jgi:hypothetical protein
MTKSSKDNDAKIDARLRIEIYMKESNIMVSKFSTHVYSLY